MSGSLHLVATASKSSANHKSFLAKDTITMTNPKKFGYVCHVFVDPIGRDVHTTVICRKVFSMGGLW